MERLFFPQSKSQRLSDHNSFPRTWPLTDVQPFFPASLSSYALSAVVNHHSRFSSIEPLICSLDIVSCTFNFSFEILFNFPSQYFFAIGLRVIFRFGRNLPPTLRRTPNLRDSKTKGDPCSLNRSYRAITFYGGRFHVTYYNFRTTNPRQKVHRKPVV